MNKKRFLSSYQNLSSVEQRVYDGVPQDCEWGETQMMSELQRQGRNIGPDQFRRCLMRLKDAGLVRQTSGGKWQRVPVHSDSPKKSKSAEEEAPQLANKIEPKQMSTLEKLAEMAQSLVLIAKEIELIALEIEEKQSSTDEEVEKMRQFKALLKDF
jgi:hypothetical protein